MNSRNRKSKGNTYLTAGYAELARGISGEAALTGKPETACHEENMMKKEAPGSSGGFAFSIGCSLGRSCPS